MRLVGRPFLAVAALFAFALSGCAGTGSPTVPTAPNHAPTARKGSLVLHIRVPRKQRKHRHRGSHYLSPLTQSITIAITGPTSFATTAPLTPTSQGCASTLASTLCTLTIPNLEPGSYSGAVSTWDTATGTGNELSANQSVSFAIVPGQNNAIGIDLGGIPTSAVLLPAAGSTLSGNATDGYMLSKCGSDTVDVYAEDYDGNIILGAGAPTPSSSPNAFTITRSAPPPLPATTVHLTATVTPDDDTGAEPVSTSAIAMTFNHDLCEYFTQYPGTDGNLWFTDATNNAIGKVTTDGVVTEYSTGISAGAFPDGITVGPDGNMWFAESAGGPAKVTTAGVITQYSPTGSTGDDIAAGPDGNVWLTYGSGVVAKITPSGVATNYTVPNNGVPLAISAGPDGYMWITQQTNGMIDRIQ